MKMMKNIMALALAFTFVFVAGSNEAAAFPSDPSSMPVPSNTAHTDSCDDCHAGGNYTYGFEEGQMCATCHIETEDGHAYSGQGTPEAPHAAHGGHNVYVDDAEEGGYDDCVGCHVNPADATDLNNDGLINDPIAGPAEDDNAGPYVPTADTDNDPSTDQVSYLTPHMNGTTPMFGAEDCGTCHEGAAVPATPETDPDGDGLTSDIEEMLGYSNSEANVDSDYDADGMTDLEEVNYNAKKKSSLDPMNADTDGDGFNDGFEVDNGGIGGQFDPIEPNGDVDSDITVEDEGEYTTSEEGTVTGTITDMDVAASPGIVTQDGTYGTVTMNGSEWTYTVNPVAALSLEAVDTFSIQYVNTTGQVVTYTASVNTTVPDSGNGVWGPIVDEDNDGLTNEQELALGTSDNNPDTDGDGIYDAYDANPTTPDVTTPVDPAYGVEAPTETPDNGNGDLTPVDPETGGEGSGESTTNPETGVTGGLLLTLGVTTTAAAGLVIRRKKN